MDDALHPFSPALQRWFSTIGSPTEPQRRGWPVIRAGGHALIAAPTGTGKTLAAFMVAIDQLIARGDQLGDETQVVYISPLKALGNDIEKNLQAPLQGAAHHDVTAPPIRVMVRTGDTSPRDRALMTKRPPHILVTTPESLAILLTSQGGRRMLRSTRSVIVDEIHALAGDKRGSHLALSLERLEHLVVSTGGCPVQRIGLSATQKPLQDIANFLVGRDRNCEIVDAGHLRHLDLGLEIPSSPLEHVTANEVWAELHLRMQELIEQHRTTLIFVNTRKLAESTAARLQDILGSDAVACHHGSLSKERRFDAEQRLKQGRLRALVATASLELGIDIGDVDLVLQIGNVSRIATFLQRAGRAGHGIHRTPKARLFPLTITELAEHAALLRAVRAGSLDRIIQPIAPLDILAQHVVAACVETEWREDELFERLRRAWPFRNLDRSRFERVLALHTGTRFSLLERDRSAGTVTASKRARLVAITCSGAIPDNADYAVKEDPEGTLVGSVEEDFAAESSTGDVFQLGTTSWQILRIDNKAGTVHVRNVGDVPPTLPFWFGEMPARSAELSEALGRLRADYVDAAWLERECMVPAGAAEQLCAHYDAAKRALGVLPTHERVIVERFFDDTGGMQMIIHAPFGSRLNRAWGLALRKKFCRGFGFELEAAANEDAFMLSLAPTNSFKLEDIWTYLSPSSARTTLTQACITGGQFEVRWRWNTTRSLMVERFSKGKRVPPNLVRLRATDALAGAFPHVLPCPENLAPGAIQIPEGHPIVDQTIHDCLTELMDIDGLEEILQAIRDGGIETVAVDTVEPSPLAGAIIGSRAFAHLDGEEFVNRRVAAVQKPTGVEVPVPGQLDPAIMAQVVAELWPSAETSTELRAILGWIGYITDAEARAWEPLMAELATQGRAQLRDGRWYSAGAIAEPVDLLRGRLEALGMVDPAAEPEWAGPLLQLETEGRVLRAECHGIELWFERGVLHRIHQRMRLGRRARFNAVSPAALLRFLARWQHADPETQLEGPQGVAAVLTQLAGSEAPAEAWVRSIIPTRVVGFQPNWLDDLCLAGDIAWGRLWRPSAGPGLRDAGGGLRFMPLSFLPREEMGQWLELAPPAAEDELGGNARTVLAALRRAGALFHQQLKQLRMMPEHVEGGLAELIAAGLVTGDAYAGLRFLMLPSDKRKRASAPRGRWGLFRTVSLLPPGDGPSEPVNEALVNEDQALFVARALIRRCGVVFRKVYERERIPLPWRSVLLALRRLELQGEVLTGRFAERFTGEQFADPHALPLLAKSATQGPSPVTISAADPLNYTGLLTADKRIPITSLSQVA
ncbi:MAG: DEAD/DEAH box helicase, partial [Planctomycetota bacterium]|nr:DEAD/DEAH box helicase [Planctomycetota bacterium]